MTLPGETGPDPKEQASVAGEEEIARLINQASSDPGLNRPFMEPKASQPKRGRGRPRKEAPAADATDGTGTVPGPDAAGAQPDPLVEIRLACRGLFNVGSGVLVRATGVPAVALTTQEIEALGDTWGGVVNRYLPDLAKTHVELVAALTVTTMVGFRIRAVLMAEIDKKKMAQAKEFKQPMVDPGNA